MNAIKIIIGNNYAPCNIEEFICFKVDIRDLNEVDNCVSECIGKYLDMNEDVWNSIDALWDDIVDACFYTVEEVMENEF